MRGALVAVVLGFALFGTRPAPAAPSAPAFADPTLRLEVATRLENDFNGVLGPTQKKQQKALLKCLALLDKPTAGGMKDLKAFTPVLRALEKAYPAELGGGVLGSEFAFTLFLAQSNASGEFSQDYYEFFQAVGKMAPSPQYTKASRLLQGAIAALDAGNQAGTLSALGKGTLKAWKLILKGAPIAAGGALLPAPSIDFTVDGLALSSQTVYWTYHSVSQTIVLSTSATDPATGDFHNLSIEFAADSLGVGSTVLSGFYTLHTDALGDETFSINEGTTTVTALDVAAHLCEGSFDLLAEGGQAISGTFSATWNLEIVED